MANNPEDCCSPDTAPRRHLCPHSGSQCHQVPVSTVAHHLHSGEILDQGDSWYFCDDPYCDLVYFSLGGTEYSSDQLRTRIGIKENRGDAPLCYCFGIDRAAALADPGLRKFVLEKTRLKECDCELLNPSGRCCLKDFPEA